MSISSNTTKNETTPLNISAIHQLNQQNQNPLHQNASSRQSSLYSESFASSVKGSEENEELLSDFTSETTFFDEGIFHYYFKEMF